jgi:putative ABC transport system permease protein
MPVFRLAMHSLKRDWRSGEVGLIAAAVVIAVASLTSVGFFTDRVHKATERQATELLAADLVVAARSPIPADLRTAARSRGLDTTETLRFRSVVVRNDKLQMAEVKAVESGYPLRGRLRIAQALFGKESITGALPQPGQAWADTRLLQALDMKVGDQITLGKSTLTVTAVLTYEPDRGGDLFNIAPRLLINLADVPATGLILPGSRVRYSLLLSGAADGIAAFRNEIEQRNEPELRIEGIRDARPELKRALERSEQFLGLAALVSIALAGLAVAMSAQRYALRHYDHCAIMRCLGAGQGFITRLYLIQLLALALIGGAAGCALGYFAQEALAALAAGMAGEALPSPSAAPLLTGLATALVTVLGFAMPQLLRLRHVAPLRVLRRDLAPAPLSGIVTYGLAILALALLTPWESGNLRLTVYVFAGIIATLVLLILGARLLIRQLDRLRTRAGAAFRFGLANIARRADLSAAQILGIGLGVMVMLLLTLIRTDLLDTWRNRLPPDAPNYFLINIQPSQAQAVRAFLRDRAGVGTELYPMVRGRLTAVNGKAVDPDSYEEPRAQRLAARDFNLSWARNLRKGNRVTAGQWWDGKNPGQTRFSVEEGIAKSLHLKLGDTLTYTVAGQTLSGAITSLRWVDWDSFNVNFFVIASPGSLEAFPATYISSFHLGKDKQVLLDLVRQFPSITVIDVDAILTQVRRIMDQVVRTIEFVFGFTVLAGIIVLLAALQTTHDERSRESALLCALGASRRQILAGLSAEFICLGLLTGLLAAFAATAVEAVLASLIFKMDIVVNPRVWLIAPLVCTVVVTACGLAGTRRALRTPPVTVLGRA